MSQLFSIGELNNPNVSGFTKENDIFELEDFGDRLANLIGSLSGSSSVFVLDGNWGSGKSYFIHQFIGLLRQRGAPVILFDAFSEDYIDDGFIALSAAIHSTATEIFEGKSGSASKFYEVAKKAANILVPIGTRILVRAITAGALDSEQIKTSGSEIKEAIAAMSDESMTAIDQVVSEKIEHVSKDNATFSHFRDTLGLLADELSDQSGKDDAKYPLVLVVDELDRCKPTFALDLIEKIKHLFSVDKICFLLVANFSQLEAVLSAKYGENFDARTYLEKFYQYRITLPIDSRRAQKRTEIYLQYLFKKHEIQFSSHDTMSGMFDSVKVLINLYQLTLRQTERVVTNIILVQRATSEKMLFLTPIIAGLCIMRIVNPELYQVARQGELKWLSTSQFLSGGKQALSDEGISELIGNWQADWWRYATGGELPEGVSGQMSSSLFRFNIFERTNLVELMCKYIDELAQN